MSLAHLPAELVIRILHMLDPGTFYICLQTSTIFREHALASTKLLMDQLSRIPGPRRVPYHVWNNKKALLVLFGRRATKHLMNGASKMVDMHIWKSLPCVERRISMLANHGNVHGSTLTGPRFNSLMFLEVQADAAVVNLYSMPEEGEGSANPKLLYVISPHNLSPYLPAYDNHGTNIYRVVNVVAHATPKYVVAVLYAPLHIPENTVAIPMKLVCFDLDPQFGPVVGSIYDIEANPWEDVVAMELLFQGSDTDPIVPVPVIVWRMNGRDDTVENFVNIYKNVLDPSTGEMRTHKDRSKKCTIPKSHSNQIGGISTQGADVHLYSSIIPIRNWTLSREGQDYKIEGRNTSLPKNKRPFVRRSIGITLACRHHHHIQDRNESLFGTVCRNTALQLMITREEQHSQPLGTLLQGQITGAFLLKAFHRPTACEEFNPGTEYNGLQHTFVAELCHLDLYNLSTLGLKMAISPRSHRIAIANWRTLLVYSVDPAAFLDRQYSIGLENDPREDLFFVHHCGWQFYMGSCKVKDDCVMLEPVQLPNTSIIRGLEWRGEDELWGWGEEGLCRWTLGASATGKRSVGVLDAVDLRDEDGDEAEQEDVPEDELKFNTGAAEVNEGEEVDFDVDVEVKEARQEAKMRGLRSKGKGVYGAYFQTSRG